MKPYNFDPELAATLALLPNATVLDIGLMREEIAGIVASTPRPDVSSLKIEDRVIAGPASHRVLGARLYSRDTASTTPRPGILHVHSGGFITGDLEQEHAWLVSLVRRLDVVVLTVDYRLAPEHPYPAALDDCFAALNWFADTADELGVDRERIALLGASAGAGLCAALALRTRDETGPKISYQVLIQPELDDRLESASINRFTDTPVWNRPRAEVSWNAYLKGLTGSAVPMYAAPARASDLSGLPSTYISVGTYDPLRDEGIAYAHALLAADVPLELHLFPGTFHGSHALDFVPISQRENEERWTVLQSALRL
jgi:acetyl esterase/lipase